MRTRRLLTALAAFGALVTLLAGPPLVLLAMIGDPLPAWASLRNGQLDDTTVIHLLGCLAWIAWAQFGLGMAVETSAALRGHSLPRRIALGQGLSRTLITLIATSLAVSAVAAPLLAGDVGRAAAAPPPAAYIAHQVGATSSARIVSEHEPTTTSSYLVGSDPAIGPTLWSIAEHKLGNPLRWTEIWQLNRDQPMSDGQRFTNPDDIHDGWVLRLPAADPTATPPATTGSYLDVVRPGDTLSHIAQAEYGNPDDYPIIAAANQGRREPDGRVFSDPNRIWPGWTLAVPALSAPTRRTPPTPTSPGTTGKPTEPTTRPRSAPTPTDSPHRLPAPASTPSISQTPSAPSQTSAVSRPTTAARDHASSTGTRTAPNRSGSDAPWIIAAEAAGGSVLAAICLAGLMRYRRQQWRHRRPGHLIATADLDQPRLARTEKALRLAAGTDTGDATWLDLALRELTASVSAQSQRPLPDVQAACLTTDRLELLLADPQDYPPPPWHSEDVATRWSRPRDRDHAPTLITTGERWAPYPSLVSVGYRDNGEHWLIDLERAGVLRLTGDATRCRNLMRFIAAELSHNTWSDHLQVTVVGFGDELVGLNPERITCTNDLDAVATTLRAQLDRLTETGDHSDLDPLAARLHNTDADVVTPHIVLLSRPDEPALQPIIRTLARTPGRIPIAVVLGPSANDQPDPDIADGGWHGHVDASGTLTLDAPLDLTVSAHQVPADEAADLAALLALAQDLTGRPMPAPRGDRPWDHYADAAGGIRTVAPADPPATDSDARADNSTAPEDARASGSEHTVLTLTATTQTDLQTLAPPLDTATRRAIQQADPALDDDLAIWRDACAATPKLHLLGPISLTGIDDAPSRRGGLLIEIIAYLATHPRGVTVEQLAADLWPHIPDAASKTTPRQSVSMSRQWLGVSPSTGRERLPRAVTDPAGAKLYRVEDVLVDAELFRRLRLRAVASGEDGVDDLRAALALVSGPPFSSRRPGGYTWLADTPLDHEYTAMIVDTAHLLATYELAAGNPDGAARAAHTALTAGALDDVALLDLVAACDAQGRHAEAEEYVRRILSNHDAEIPEDLPPRTYEILRRLRISV